VTRLDWRRAASIVGTMPIIYLVRHGRADAADSNASDPGLDSEGEAQAHAVAQELAASIAAPATILTSPLRRCRSTAAPLAKSWSVGAQLEPRIMEVPSPQPAGRGREEWLKAAFSATWNELEQTANAQDGGFCVRLAAWRAGIGNAILECRGDTVAFTHFVPINVLVGIASNQKRVVCFRPEHCSVTVIETSGHSLRLVKLGREATRRVL
jgi:broad specificity phosphatase PhoE